MSFTFNFFHHTQYLLGEFLFFVDFSENILDFLDIAIFERK